MAQGEPRVWVGLLEEQLPGIVYLQLDEPLIEDRRGLRSPPQRLRVRHALRLLESPEVQQVQVDMDPPLLQRVDPVVQHVELLGVQPLFRPRPLRRQEPRHPIHMVKPHQVEPRRREGRDNLVHHFARHEHSVLGNVDAPEPSGRSVLEVEVPVRPHEQEPMRPRGGLQRRAEVHQVGPGEGCRVHVQYRQPNLRLNGWLRRERVAQ